MKQYEPRRLAAISRYRKYLPTLPADVRWDVYARMEALLAEERRWCDKGNYKHIAQILTAIALYETLQAHGKTEPQAFEIVSTEMWKMLTPETYQKLARFSWFMPAMKKILPFGFRHGSGAGWRYDWHLDEDGRDRFHFECRECLYKHIFEARGLMKLGAMFCHSDVINFGSLPYTDFRRTKTLCQGGDCCDFDFVRHATDAGDGWQRSQSV